MKTLSDLFENNRRWVEAMTGTDPDFFRRLSGIQRPDYLWIGCSDSRMPANQIVGLAPGELFVHRNVANVVVHTDVNCQSVLEFAVEVLGVRHVIVCGHYGCGGVHAALERARHGLVDHWLRHVRDVRENHRVELDSITEGPARVDRLCELNVLQQVRNVAATPIVQQAWGAGKSLSVHAWIYDLRDGRLRELAEVVDRAERVPPSYRIG